MWEMEILFLIIFLIAIDIGFAIGFLKFKISSVFIYLAAIVNTIVIVLLFIYFNVGGIINEYQPFGGELNITDITLESLELGAFIAIFCVAVVARAKYPVIGGKGWNLLILAVTLGCIGMFFDIYGEFLNLNYYSYYKLATNSFQIAGIIGLALAFLMFYRFSEILFSPSPDKT